MSPNKQLENFANLIYLTIKNRYYDDIAGEDGQTFTRQAVDWTNSFLDELENAVHPNDGKLVDWWFMRENQAELGTAEVGSNVVALPSSVDRLLTDENRYVQITVNDIVISQWQVVQPGDINNKRNGIAQPDRCAVVGTDLVFSRVFKDTENDGTVTGDVVNALPRLAYTLDGFTVKATNVQALSLVKPKQLLVLGVAKNATLPDIVQGGLSPSYVQKFNDLLTGAMTRSRATSVAKTAPRDSFNGVGGVY